MTKPAIAFVINSLAGGGAERAMVNLLAQSSQQLERYQVHLVLLDSEPEAYPVPAHVSVHRLDSARQLAASVRHLHTTLRAIRPSLVVSALTRSNLTSVMLSGVLHYRTIICEHAHTGTHHTGFSGFIARHLVQFLYPKADVVVGVSGGIVADLRDHFGVSASRCVAIPNVINVDAILRQAEEPPLVAPPRSYLLAMGRLVASKNFPLLIEAFAQSSFSGELVILGEGAERPTIDAAIKRLGLTERVQMPGFVENPFPVIRGAAGYVLPSNAEGLPTGLIEAMIVGVPVIATNCRSGPSEILAGQVNMAIEDLTEAAYGILVPTNDPAPLARAISMLDDPETRAALALKAQAGATRYHPARIVKQYWSIIEGQLALASPGSQPKRPFQGAPRP